MKQRSLKQHIVHVAAGVALVASSWMITSCSVNPATGERQLALVGESQEIAMGQEADKAITAQLGLVEDRQLQRYVNTLGRRLASRSERPNLPWEFKVVDDPTVNAFALPGGYIYVTRGMLAHMNSEAELAGVLGHEIGHVTARHGVEQMSRAQLAQIGLLAGMVAGGEQFQRWGNLAQTGVGLLFLKFGRDDERQSDDLGLRYMSTAGYQADQMPETFRTLQRVSAAQGSGRIPAFLSTHPDPGNRVARLNEEIAAMPAEQRNGEVRRAEYLSTLEGLDFGQDPREGFFKGNTFYHPELAFQIDFPQGWNYANQKQAVGAVSPNQDAQVVLSLAPDQSSPRQAAAQFFQNNQGLQRGQNWSNQNFYYFRTDPQMVAQGGQDLAGLVGFVEHKGTVFQIAGLTVRQRWNNNQRAVESSLSSFARLTDPRYLNVKAPKIDVVKLPQAMTLGEFAQRYPSSVDLQELAIINGVDSNTRLQAGTSVKRVVGGKLP